MERSQINKWVFLLLQNFIMLLVSEILNEIVKVPYTQVPKEMNN